MKKDKVAIWRARIALAKEARQKYEREWLDNINWFASKFTDIDLSRGDIFINFVWSTIKVLVPSVYNKQPEVLTFPTRPEVKEQAFLFQTALNRYLKIMRLKRNSKRCLIDAFLCGLGWYKIGYLAKTEEKPVTGIEALGNLLKAEPNMDEVIGLEKPVGIRVSPFNVLLDPTVKSIDDCGWMIHQVVRKLDDVKRDKKYHDTYNLTATGTLISENLRKIHSSYDTKVDCELITLNEIWDVEETKLYALPEGQDNGHFIREIDFPYIFENDPFPLVPLVFNEHPNELYPINDIKAWIPQQLEINEIRTQMLNHIKRFKRIYLTDGVITEGEIEAINRAPDGGIVRVTDLEKIKPLDDAPIPNEIYPAQQVVRDDLFLVSGIAEAQRSMTSRTKTATESVIMDSQARVRSGERIDILDDFHMEIAVKLADIIAQYVPKPLLIRYFTQGNMQFGQLTEGDLSNIHIDYDFDIRATSASPINKEVFRKQLMDIYLMTKGDPNVDSRPILEEILKTFDFQNLLQVFTPPPMPMGTGGNGGINPDVMSRQAGGPDRQVMLRQMMQGAGIPGQQKPGTKVGGLISLPPGGQG